MTKTAHAKWMIGSTVAAACAATSACADFKRATALAPAGVNIESPVAGTVADASRRSYRYPRFKQLPLKPKTADIRKPASFKAEVADLDAKEAKLHGWTLANPPFNAEGESYAEGQRKRFPSAVGADAPPPESTDLSEAWAAARRAAAQAPAPPPPSAPK